jgi:hypothetical protein
VDTAEVIFHTLWRHFIVFFMTVFLTYTYITETLQVQILKTSFYQLSIFVSFKEQKLSQLDIKLLL